MESVLIVDDEPAIRWTLTQSLHEWGLGVIESKDAATAVSRFENMNPIAVLLDINLPDGSGLELLRRFKRMRPATPVIIISGEVIVENTIEALRGGADDFIAKPVDLNELHVALESCLSPKPSQVGAGKSKILLVSDSEERLRDLRSMIETNEIEIETAKTREEWEAAFANAHDVAVVDLNTAQLRVTLPRLRESAAHAQIPVLVSLNQIAGDPNAAGLLPQYRAMPCSLSEIAVLMQRRARARAEIRIARQLL